MIRLATSESDKAAYTIVLYYTVFGVALVAGSEMSIALVGPTAAGKTAVGVLLAQRLGAEIVSADSVQVYRRLDIGAAKPTAAERALARFHLVDIVDPDRDWTLSDTQAAAAEAAREIEERGNLPLIVGGTGLYIRALTTHLDIPTVPPNEELRERWRGVAVEHGNTRVHGELAKVDPEAAARIHVNDLKRTIRALEVYAALGTTLSALHARNQAKAEAKQSLIIGLNYADRRELYSRIEKRVDRMMEEGLEGEVRALLDDGYSPELKSMQSLGYRHMCEYIAGNLSSAEAVDSLKRDTRHFARRQLIWFRGDARVRWILLDDKSLEQAADEAGLLIERFRQGTLDYNRGTGLSIIRQPQSRFFPPGSTAAAHG